ncbi:MAG TPA: aminotransferase class I/II-fold pyridoxal phosphate-dependent enzyme [Actinomycetota bacterium]|jgi:alanine-synthesizing transaminase|nr:aminotransferase class I/II-fold pyridoxal phosphate-dependent enzyme [Actinomycetota bacterium]
MEFRRIERFPPYVFSIVNDLKARARREGEDIVDLGMGNPDIPTPEAVVEKLREAALNPRNHRYSASKGIPKLRRAVCDLYARGWGVELDPETEAVVTIGAKEGLSHLAWVLLQPGDSVLVPEPTYPIHTYAMILAGATITSVPLSLESDFFGDLVRAYERSEPKPRVVLCSFPHNPTTAVVDVGFFEQLVEFARARDVVVIHDLAYADLVFDAERAPSLLQVKGAKDVGVEFFSMSKSYSMPGWRVAFCVGNPAVIGALTKLKSYLDYGVFQAIQVASIIALNECEEVPKQIREVYRARRDVLCEAFGRAGWEVPSPPATMFAWAPIPEPFRHMGSLEFAKLLVREAKVAVSPGVGFGPQGDDHIRFALVENEQRIRQAARGVRRALEAGPPG